MQKGIGAGKAWPIRMTPGAALGGLGPAEIVGSATKHFVPSRLSGTAQAFVLARQTDDHCELRLPRRQPLFAVARWRQSEVFLDYRNMIQT
jgi:hypothetical protein